MDQKERTVLKSLSMGSIPIADKDEISLISAPAPWLNLRFVSGRLAQLVRATGLHPVGRRFESCGAHHPFSRQLRCRKKMECHAVEQRRRAMECHAVPVAPQPKAKAEEQRRRASIHRQLRLAPPLRAVVVLHFHECEFTGIIGKPGDSDFFNRIVLHLFQGRIAGMVSFPVGGCCGRRYNSR